MQNWKTTVVGVLGGALMAATGHDAKTLIVSFVMAALGILAKDFNVTL